MTKEIQKSSSKYIVAVAFAVIAAALYLFWAFPYRAALGYREEMQLFQTTGTYFADFTLRPAGIAIYIGEFLTQFFNNYWIGAAVMSLLMAMYGVSCYLICIAFAKKAPKIISFLLAILPLISLWLSLGNQDVTLGFVTALLTVTFSAYLYISTDADYSIAEKYLQLIVATSLLYWLAGPITIVFTLIIITFICLRGQISVANRACLAIASIIILAANVYAWALILTYPFSYQLIGIGYLLIPDVLKADQLIVEASCVIVPIAAYIISRGNVSKKIILPILALIVAVPSVCLYPKAYDKAVYRLIDYDYMVRANDWDGIIRYSDAHTPNRPLSVSATNLASGMTGQLDSRAFDYYQNGTEGLFPSFSKEAISSWTTGEIFFQLGLINSAQRFYFEGMEAIPNYNKSARAVRRLAETAMIRGEYALAEKYLHLLENTTFYRNWARRNLELIKDPKGVEAHPLYGTLSSRMVNEDYLFSEGELDKTLEQLFIKDPSNDLARQYLILYPLLQRDLNKFVQYMGVVAESHPQYNPLLAQQALAFISMKNGQPIPQNMVSPAVEQSLRGFAQAWTSKNPDLIDQHRHTLYYYLISNE
ncbi:MAG: hypothetical protein K2J58_02860 [Muribaculaceae bacterium]|nr:hypothetical protein [Muribaculaceae bacterium]